MNYTDNHFLKKVNPLYILATYYVLIVSVSTILLSLPFIHRTGHHLSLIDALFISASAVSVTGLSPVNIAETFNGYGIAILIVILQVGGFGVMTISTFFWLVVGKKIGLKQRKLIMSDQNQLNLSGLVNMLKQIIVIILLIEVIGAIILSIYFTRYYPTLHSAIVHGIFASVSATTNGGFDITGNSLIPFAHDYFVQMINMILITLGSIGFPVLIEVKNFCFNVKNKKAFRFSLFTKLTTTTYAMLLIFGTAVIWILELHHSLQGKGVISSFFYAFFQSNTTRSAGLVTLDLNQFSDPTLLIMSGLMFVGASPSSVGGGIRTTTFAVVLLFLFYFAKGNPNIKIFKREIHPDDVRKALAVTMLSILICMVATICLMISEHGTLLHILFEVSSAFGTTGTSLGLTEHLTTFGKIVVIILMVIGRVGVLSFIWMLGGKDKTAGYRYSRERLIVG